MAGLNDRQAHGEFVRLDSGSTNASAVSSSHNAQESGGGGIRPESDDESSRSPSLSAEDAFLVTSVPADNERQVPIQRKTILQQTRSQASEQVRGATSIHATPRNIHFDPLSPYSGSRRRIKTPHPGYGSYDAAQGPAALSSEPSQPETPPVVVPDRPNRWTPSTWGGYNPAINEYPWIGLDARPPSRSRWQSPKGASHPYRSDIQRRERRAAEATEAHTTHLNVAADSSWWFAPHSQRRYADIEMATRKMSPFAENSSDETLADPLRVSSPPPRPQSSDTIPDPWQRSGLTSRRFTRAGGLTRIDDPGRIASYEAPAAGHHQSEVPDPPLYEEDASGCLSYDQALQGAAREQTYTRASDQPGGTDVAGDVPGRPSRPLRQRGNRKFRWSRKQPTSQPVSTHDDPSSTASQTSPSDTYSRSTATHSSDEDTLAFWTSDTDLDLVNTTPTFILLHRLISQWDEVLLYLEATHLRAFPPPSEPGQLRRYLLLWGLMGSITVGVMAWATFFCQRTEEQGDKVREGESDSLKKDWLQRKMRKRRRRRREERDRLKALIRTRHRAQLELAVRTERPDWERAQTLDATPGRAANAAGGGVGTPGVARNKSQMQAQQSVAMDRDKEAQSDWVGRWSREVSTGSMGAAIRNAQGLAAASAQTGASPVAVASATSPPFASTSATMGHTKSGSIGAGVTSGDAPAAAPYAGWEGILLPHSTSTIAAALGATVAAQERAVIATGLAPSGTPMRYPRANRAASQTPGPSTSAGLVTSPAPGITSIAELADPSTSNRATRRGPRRR
ncbi:unnamed protein product [Parajaminaea phylloscopi]